MPRPYRGKQARNSKRGDDEPSSERVEGDAPPGRDQSAEPRDDNEPTSILVTKSESTAEATAERQHENGTPTKPADESASSASPIDKLDSNLAASPMVSSRNAGVLTPMSPAVPPTPPPTPATSGPMDGVATSQIMPPVSLRERLDETSTAASPAAPKARNGSRASSNSKTHTRAEAEDDAAPIEQPRDITPLGENTLPMDSIALEQKKQEESKSNQGSPVPIGKRVVPLDDVALERKHKEEHGETVKVSPASAVSGGPQGAPVGTAIVPLDEVALERKHKKEEQQGLPTKAPHMHAHAASTTSVKSPDVGSAQTPLVPEQPTAGFGEAPATASAQQNTSRSTNGKSSVHFDVEPMPLRPPAKNDVKPPNRGSRIVDALVIAGIAVFIAISA